MTSSSRHTYTICFVSLEIYPTTPGGVGILLHHTIFNLLRLGYKVILLVALPPDAFTRFRDVDSLTFPNRENFVVYNLEDIATCDVASLRTIPCAEIRRSAHFALALQTICDLHTVDFIEFYDYCGPAYYSLGLDLHNSPIIAVRLHNTIELIARTIRSPYDDTRLAQFAAERISLLGADLLLSPGETFWQSHILPLYPELRDRPMQTSPPIHRPVGKIVYNTSSRNVLFYGRLSTFKGLDTFLLGALTALNNTAFVSWVNKFVIVGPEETVGSALSLEEMKTWIPAHHLERFHFIGRVSHDELMAILLDTAFACFANRMESFCYAAHELHTAGIPLIVASRPAFIDHFDNGKTAIFFDNTAGHLAETMINISRNPHLRAQLSSSGQSRAESYLTDYYGEHLRHTRKQCRDDHTTLDAVILVLATDNSPALEDTLNSLSSFPGRIYVLRSDLSGSVAFATRRWLLQSAAGAHLESASVLAGDLLICVRAGDELSRAWWDQALRLLTRRADVGSVSGWLQQDDTILMQDTALLPELAYVREPGLRTLIRTNHKNSLLEVLSPRPGMTESAMMLKLRSEGNLCLTLPVCSCDISKAIDLGSPSVHQLLCYDFDRISPNVAASIFNSNPGRQAWPVSLNQQFLFDTANDRNLVYVEIQSRRFYGDDGGDEVKLLRIFTTAKSTALPQWNSVTFSKDWTLIHDSNGPISGSMEAVSRGLAWLTISMGGRIDFLGAPWAGVVRIYFQGKAHNIDLNRPTVSDVSVTFLDGSIRITGGAPSDSLKSDTHCDTSGSLVPPLARLGAQCPTLFISESSNDFALWPRALQIAQRTTSSARIQHGNFTFGRPSLASLVQSIAATKVVVSSSVKYSPTFANALATLPANVGLFIAICQGAETAPEENSRLAAISGWLSMVRDSNRTISVMGADLGLLALFAHCGAHTILVPMLRAPASIDCSDASDTQLEVAIIPGALGPERILHLINAVFLAHCEGTPIVKLWIPISSRPHVERVLRDIHFIVDVAYYSDAHDLVIQKTKTRKLALGCFPQAQMPQALLCAAAGGWLPICGNVCELDTAPTILRDSLCETYWEDSLEVARKLRSAADRYSTLILMFNTFAHAQSLLGDAVIDAVMSSVASLPRN